MSKQVQDLDGPDGPQSSKKLCCHLMHWKMLRLCSSLKCRAAKLCSECELELRNILQDPLLVQAQWSYKVSEVLASSADVTDFPRVAVMVQNIQVRTFTVLPSLPVQQQRCNSGVSRRKSSSRTSANLEGVFQLLVE